MEEDIMSDYYKYSIAKRDCTKDLRMPDKKNFYVDKHFDREAYDRAVFELQEKIYSLSNINPTAVNRIADFTESVSQQLLLNGNRNNQVFSPISIYVALASLSLLSDGTSQKQIMDLIGYDSQSRMMEDFRSIMQPLSVSTSFYKNLVSSSLWFNDQTIVNNDVIQSLADYLGTNSFSGAIDDPSYTAAMEDWLNKAAGNMLKEASNTVSFNGYSVMNVNSAILFKALWDDEFNLSKTKPGTFQSPNGPVQVSYMFQDEKGTVFFGNTFTAVSKGLSYGNSMLFVLPNEGYSPEDLIAGEEIYQLLSINKNDISQERYIIHETIPKFDITQNIEISEVLKKAGVTDIFDVVKANLENSVKATDNVYISKLTHSCRLKIDERGCEGAAITVAFAAASCAGPKRVYDFVLDRPFIAVVRSSNKCPLFFGIVNDPSQS